MEAVVATNYLDSKPPKGFATDTKVRPPKVKLKEQEEVILNAGDTFTIGKTLYLVKQVLNRGRYTIKRINQ